ncbi:MAG: V-type ATP synthase subunit D, partial [Planctomycetota bacterium]
MAKRKIKYTRTELKQQRDALKRFERYLPTLKLKQQQVQGSIVQTHQELAEIQSKVNATERAISAYKGLYNDVAGANFRQMATPDKVRTSRHSIAGVYVPRFKQIIFPAHDYSLFGTSPWVD